MANVTDPLARPIHGTNPQNLIEYITRQRIYDSQYWKEHLFGCTAADVAEKAAIQLKAIGGSYGGNAKPTRFLSLVLKMLQIQPDDEIVYELIANENFKYVRALGAFYLRLTGRPADIYEKLEPLYHDSRKLKYRNPMDWRLMHLDELIDELLTENRVCGIALPRLPNRDVLVDAGYLDGPRKSTVCTKYDLPLNDIDSMGDAKLDYCTKAVERIEEELKNMAQGGVALARSALVERGHKFEPIEERKDAHESKHMLSEKKEGGKASGESQIINNGLNESGAKRKSSDKPKSKKKKKFGSLFKTSVDDKVSDQSRKARTKIKGSENVKADGEEGNNEYWNAQREKLGLKPLKE
eukprot:255920_1